MELTLCVGLWVKGVVFIPREENVATLLTTIRTRGMTRSGETTYIG